MALLCVSLYPLSTASRTSNASGKLHSARPARPIIGRSVATTTMQDFRHQSKEIQNEENCCILFRGRVDDAVARFRSGENRQGQDGWRQNVQERQDVQEEEGKER